MSWRTLDDGHDWADDEPVRPWEVKVPIRPRGPKRKRKKPEGGPESLQPVHEQDDPEIVPTKGETG